MRHIMKEIEHQLATYKEHPLFPFLRDRTVDPRKRLAFAPNAAHYILTFSDLCRYVLREEPAQDRLQELVNAQAHEDAEHWRWFVSDLAKLGHDRTMKFSDALSALWADQTVRSRILSYKLCRLAFGASSLHKLVATYCIEATADAMLASVVVAAEDWTKETGEPLAFFGANHIEAEEEHALWTSEVRNFVASIELEENPRADLIRVVVGAFEAFTDFNDELWAISRAATSAT